MYIISSLTLPVFQDNLSRHCPFSSEHWIRISKSKKVNQSSYLLGSFYRLVYIGPHNNFKIFNISNKAREEIAGPRGRVWYGRTLCATQSSPLLHKTLEERCQTTQTTFCLFLSAILILYSSTVLYTPAKNSEMD